MDRRVFLITAAAAAGVGGAARGAEEKRVLTAESTPDWVLVKNGAGRPVLRYITGRHPEGERAPAVPGTCYTHPLATPSGEVVTDLAPADHVHHRGVFCAWVQVDGAVSGDWWGWGAKAPKENRVIRNRTRRVELGGSAGPVIRVVNAWEAENVPLLQEELALRVSEAAGCTVADYEYRYSVLGATPAVIGQNPFGGFCYRARPRGTQEIVGPEGPGRLPDSVHNRAEMNWPASRWYDMTYRSPEGRASGVAVLNHPGNPTSTWHVVRGIHMLNPCITAGRPVTIDRGNPLVLRYRLVAHDGDAASAPIERLYRDFTAREANG